MLHIARPNDNEAYDPVAMYEYRSRVTPVDRQRGSILALEFIQLATHAQEYYCMDKIIVLIESLQFFLVAYCRMHTAYRATYTREVIAVHDRRQSNLLLSMQARQMNFIRIREFYLSRLKLGLRLITYQANHLGKEENGFQDASRLVSVIVQSYNTGFYKGLKTVFVRFGIRSCRELIMVYLSCSIILRWKALLVSKSRPFSSSPSAVHLDQEDYNLCQTCSN